MTDAQLFLCVVLFFYLSGRCLWRPARTLAFRSILFTSYQPVVEPSTLSNRTGSLLLCDPFVPLRPVYLADLPPLLFAPEGVAVPRSDDVIGVGAGLCWTRYEEIKAVANHERAVKFSGQMARCRTAPAAAELAAKLDALRSLPSAERAERIRAGLKRPFNLKEARRTLRETSRSLTQLRGVANVWLAGIFLVYLLGAARFGYASMTLFLLLALEGAAIHLSIQFYRIHRRFFPNECRFRAGELLKFLCCSPTAFHCVDAISANLLARFHPLVVAHLVCRPPEFDRHCTRWVRALKYEQADANENERWLRAELERLVGAFLQGIGRTSESYLAAPRRFDPESHSYCPRCEAQYQFAHGVCPDCHVGVLPFSTDSK